MKHKVTVARPRLACNFESRSSSRSSSLHNVRTRTKSLTLRLVSHSVPNLCNTDCFLQPASTITSKYSPAGYCSRLNNQGRNRSSDLHPLFLQFCFANLVAAIRRVSGCQKHWGDCCSKRIVPNATTSLQKLRLKRNKKNTSAFCLKNGNFAFPALCCFQHVQTSTRTHEESKRYKSLGGPLQLGFLVGHVWSHNIPTGGNTLISDSQPAKPVNFVG